MVLGKTLESPLDCKEIQPVHSEEISPGISLEGMMLKLKLLYFGHLMLRVDSLEKTPMLGQVCCFIDCKLHYFSTIAIMKYHILGS